MHIGNDGTVTNLGLPSASSTITWLAPQSENQTRPSCQRGDSPKTTPSISTVILRQTARAARTHRSAADAPPAAQGAPRRARRAGRAAQGAGGGSRVAVSTGRA